ncbi:MULTISPECIES: lysophospholipid acyltransferase family protein [unclassified Campylobacter]|uniref:lysophospholipid acyltransferase family protein n=1 Tax=unclassified Campylobacter TaxID=2593542 RepID=UPI001237B88D|nr:MULTISPECIES: lysophospholipid acyltransferase family protein [unclassified Campylobacter]KAA6224952.1 DUF374 domain-containing protein [Campylobacter sp. LR286c]KAA6228384.1 DUF374 domain-containing protein [Campylobacter sp. LR185c]KAA6228870.1 DUF374 domain-containing protein [Campylobacter sp. LR196d]KAA6229824.1 DUF374 domain-containing protein [Campylobacter sp. LR264d]KAA6234035.1 DUF374 domain-containing protein [Campylobacter sp. LR291e]
MVKSFKETLLSLVIVFFQWLIFLTCIKSYRGEKIDEKPCVILFWHGRLALMPFAFRHFRIKDKKAYVMISHHKDGQRIANIIKFYDLNSVRGSTFKGAKQAIKESFKILDEKNDLVITPDGPRGPFHSISDGAVLIALKKNVKIRLLNYESSNFWQFKSWDKMILPKPFSRIVYRLSEPLDISGLEKEQAKQLIQKEFKKIYQLDSFKE